MADKRQHPSSETAPVSLRARAPMAPSSLATLEPTIPAGERTPALPTLQSAAHSAGRSIQRQADADRPAPSSGPAAPAIPRRPGTSAASLWMQRASRDVAAGSSPAEALVQRSEGGPPAMSAAKVESYLAHPSGGRSLEAPVQRQMEHGFGRRMDGVRVHTDSAADVACKSLGAQAFANGQNVFFAQGKYNPSSSSGKHLLAHELTHTIQQTGGGGDVHARLEVGQAGSSAEREADATAALVIQRSEGAAAGGGAPAAGGAEGAAQTQEVAPGAEAGAPAQGGAEADPELAAMSPEDREKVQQLAGTEKDFSAKSGLVPQQAAAGAAAAGQPKLVVGRANDRYEQEADRVADAVTAGGGSNRSAGVQRSKDGAVQKKDDGERGFWKPTGGGSRAIAGPSGVPAAQRRAADGARPEISAAPGGTGAPIQRMSAEAISAAAAVVQITWQIANDVIRATEDDVTWSFDRMTGIKCPGDNANWNNVDGAQWSEHWWDLTWYKTNGFGTRTGMTARLHWESNGYAINGVYFTKRTHNDAASWGATFVWLVQNLQQSGTGARGFPKAKVRWAASGSWTRTFASTIHDNVQGTIDAEGGQAVD